MMRTASILIVLSFALRAQETVQVPGISQLFLAAQPAGSTYGIDSSPLNAPPQSMTVLVPGQALVFSAVGAVTVRGVDAPITPSGSANRLTKFFGGPNGFGGLFAPSTALIGMFLADRISPAADVPVLDFSAGAQEATVIAPLLQQPFYIGDGRSPAGGQRNVIIPAGATRLFLAVDTYGNDLGNSQNTGSFTVIVRSVNPPNIPGNPLAVPGISDLFLAAQQPGTRAPDTLGGPDSVPLNSPPQVMTPIIPGQVLRIVASGQIGIRGNPPSIPPSGAPNIITTFFSGPYGFSGLKAFGGALIGVFVGDRLDAHANPASLDFTGGALDLTALSPLLQQLFYVGDGKTSSGTLRRFTVPAGATRLFLAVNVSGNDIGNGGYSGSFLATVSPELPNTPVIAQQGVTNAAGFGTRPIPAGSIAAMFGSNFSANTALAAVTPLPTNLASTTIWTDLTPAPLFFTSVAQANFQIPFEMGNKRIQVVVNANGIASLPTLIDLQPAFPGIFVSDTGAPIIVSAATGNLVSAVNPTRPGDTLIIYATGLPPPAPAPASGISTPFDHLYNSLSNVTIKLGAVSLRPFFAGLAPGLIGVYQLNVTIPSNTPSGTSALQVEADGNASNTVQIVVQDQ